MTQTIIKSHEFSNKNRVEFVFDEGNYATIGKVQSFLVFFLEYNDGPYHDDGKEDHHYMVNNSVYFPLNKFDDAGLYYQYTVDFYNVNFDETIDKAQKDTILEEILSVRETITSYSLDEIKELNESKFNEKKEGTLPGALIFYKHISCTGSHENAWGVGSMDISLNREGSYPWIDLIDVKYSNPTVEQLLDAQTSSTFSKASEAHSNINRRVSRKQATYIQKIIIEALHSKLGGVIPADDEL